MGFTGQSTDIPEDEPIYDAGIADMIAAVLSGMAGTSYVGELNEKISNEQLRREREKVRADEKAERDADRATDDERYQSMLFRELAPLLGEEFADSPQGSVPQSPMTMTPGAELGEGIGVAPNAHEGTTQGIPESVLGYLEGNGVTGSQRDALLKAGRGMGERITHRREVEKQEARDEAIWQNVTVEKMKNGFQPGEETDDEYWEWAGNQRGMNDELLRLQMAGERARIAASLHSMREKPEGDLIKLGGEARAGIAARYDVLRAEAGIEEGKLTIDQKIDLWYKASDSFNAQYADSPEAQTVILIQRQLVAQRMRANYQRGLPVSPTSPSAPSAARDRPAFNSDDRRIGDDIAAIREGLGGLSETVPTSSYRRDPMDPR